MASILKGLFIALLKNEHGIYYIIFRTDFEEYRLLSDMNKTK